MEKIQRVLVFSHDDSLLSNASIFNEARFRQKNYCSSLFQERNILVLCDKQERNVISESCSACGSGGNTVLSQIARAVAAGFQLCRQWHPDVIEYQCALTTGIPAFWCSKLFNIPMAGGVFNDFIDNPTWIRNSLFRCALNRFSKYILASTDHIRCDSNDTVNALKGKGFLNTTFIPFFIPNADLFVVADDVIEARRKQWYECPTLLCVARLSPEKNIRMLLEAVSKCEKIRKIKLLMAGSGDDEAYLKGLAIGLGIESSVNWLGKVEYNNLPQLFSQATVFALPSDSETTARVLVLARISRLPTVSTNTSGSTMIISDESGRLSNVGDLDAFSRHLVELITNPMTFEHFLRMSPFNFEKFSHDGVLIELKRYYQNFSHQSLESH